MQYWSNKTIQSSKYNSSGGNGTNKCCIFETIKDYKNNLIDLIILCGRKYNQHNVPDGVRSPLVFLGLIIIEVYASNHIVNSRLVKFKLLITNGSTIKHYQCELSE